MKLSFGIRRGKDIYLMLFSGFTTIQFPGGVAKKGDNVEIVCVFGHAESLTSITWFRNRVSGISERIVTLTSSLQIKHGDEKFEGRIATKAQEQLSSRDGRFTLLDVDHNDISEYWCEVEPNIYKRSETSKLQVKGCNVLVVFQEFLFIELLFINS